MPGILNVTIPKKYRIKLLLKLAPICVTSGTGYALYHTQHKIWEDYKVEVARSLAQLNMDNY